MNSTWTSGLHLCFILTPEGHKHSIEYCAWVVKQISKLCIAAHLTEVPEVAAHIDVTEWTHFELSSTVTHLCSQLVRLHGAQTIQEHHEPNQCRW